MNLGSGGRATTTWPMGFFFPFASGAKQVERGDKPGRVIAVCSVKGGVGKTTTAVNLAAALSLEPGLQVLLIDADPQGHAGGCMVDIAGDGSIGLADVLPKRGASLTDAVVGTSQPGLHLVAAGQGLQAAEVGLANRIGRETVLKGLLETTRTFYDYVILDCAPSLSLLAVGALVAADAVLIPCEPSPLAICGLGSLLTAMQDVKERLNQSLQVLGVVLTRVDGRNKNQNAEALEALQKIVGDHLLQTSIGVSTELARARVHGKPTVLQRPTSRGALQYTELAQEVRRLMEGERDRSDA